MSGPVMKRHLHTLGIPAQRVVRRRKTGEYQADFFVPLSPGEMLTHKQAVLPSQAYAAMLCERIPDIHITHVGELVTNWRDNPADHVRYEAFVSFRVE
jgi:hypothetical protein